MKLGKSHTRSHLSQTPLRFRGIPSTQKHQTPWKQAVATAIEVPLTCLQNRNRVTDVKKKKKRQTYGNQGVREGRDKLEG